MLNQKSKIQLTGDTIKQEDKGMSDCIDRDDAFNALMWQAICDPQLEWLKPPRDWKPYPYRRCPMWVMNQKTQGANSQTGAT